MTISIWRYSHLALAVSSFVFILLASITGIILAFQPISEQIQPYKVADLNTISVAELVTVFKDNYPEIIDVKVDTNDFVIASVFTEEGDNLEGYFNPKTAEYLGEEIEVSKFFQWVTSLHRSLFLKGIGRFFVGLCSFLLFLIAVSGSVLILKRQRSLKKFFSKIVNENFNQYWHVVLGRLSLIPIIIITVTGVYLSLEKFDLLPKAETSHNIDFDSLSTTPTQAVSEFKLFKNTPLSQVKSLEFPFSEDVEDYFILKLKDKEVIVNQFTGAILSEIKSPLVDMFSGLSLNLHTGKGSILWSIILAIATANILFFIYSGFAMTLKRRASKLKNKYKKDDAKYIILVGSENGSTLPFANAFHQQLLKAGETSYISELNNYNTYKKAEHLIIITATYGLGEPPTNASKFLERLKAVQQEQTVSYSVVGFGSLAYPAFCKFAFDVDKAMQIKYNQLLEPFTINDKSVEAFSQWIQKWNDKVGLKITVPKDGLVSKPKTNKKLKIISKTKVSENPDDTFLITLKPKKTYKFTSGDLLAVYPKNDYRERLYSIGKVNGNIQLSVKYYENGLASNYLNNFQINNQLKARIIQNSAFHFPKKASRVVLIANGTGIAPFLGMLHQNRQTETHLYLGLRTQESNALYESQINALLKQHKLTKFHLILSQEDKKRYVQDVLFRDAIFIAETLNNKGIIMICGSLAMQNGVLNMLESICVKYNNKPLSYYQNNLQIKTDCY
ncbi:sulfite reductase (NADPH) flavoprotein alpha-component [Flaviramulus basaltis]|uniref:Sulfite reductase (NADPH) flavoprotein alpha-component n=1 Tax=Flaviramulus basaltis TaxID=369401 RepID=A0A1K2IDG1_9FLAO|nr:PepSY domain-containing protein [Flaviramulus basaltis]SFZ90468.1 sulfite reductase (NADPH) flavoprotein alpha-component [Flaviramulus basaltis]